MKRFERSNGLDTALGPRVKGGIRPHSLPIFNFSELCGENAQNKLGRICT